MNGWLKYIKTEEPQVVVAQRGPVRSAKHHHHGITGNIHHLDRVHGQLASEKKEKNKEKKRKKEKRKKKRDSNGSMRLRN